MCVEPERVLRNRASFAFGGKRVGTRELSVSAVRTDGHASIERDLLVVRLAPSPHQATYKLKIACGPFAGNGASVRLKVSGFATLRPFQLGLNIDGDFRKLQVPNLWLDRWVDVSLGLTDLAFRIQNGWEMGRCGDITELHLHFSGAVADDGATVELSGFELWDEQADDFRLSVRGSASTFRRIRQETELWTQFEPMPTSLFEVLDGYLRHHVPEAEDQARAFMARGDAPSFRTLLPWHFDERQPLAIAALNTYRWSWHALYSVTVLVCHARKSGRLAPLFAARDLVNTWLDHGFYAIDPDQKYAWYDHGVADRLMALVLVWDYGIRLGFDQRFMARLLDAIERHMRLLGSEAFYACHQRTRYHNHAVFQDIWLMFASLAVPALAGSQRYFEIAVARVSDQIERLLVEDGECAVLIENSVSYHQGFEWMVALVDQLMRIGQAGSKISTLVQGMRRFLELARYPDGRLPGIGDSPRTANSLSPEDSARRPYVAPDVHALPRAGHVFVKGNHGDRSFMLTVSATSLTETHKHEDNLSFTLFFDGVEWLIDPSFHSYEPGLSLARYLRRAVAHNAVVLLGEPYALTAGLTQLDGVRCGEEFRIEGEHRAYAHTRVKRRIEGRLDRLSLSFADEVESVSGARFAGAVLMLHCGENVEVIRSDSHLVLSHPGSSFRLGIELPSSRVRTFTDAVDGDEPRGVTGLGFSAHGPITSVECAIEDPRDVRWQVHAVQ